MSLGCFSLVICFGDDVYMWCFNSCCIRCWLCFVCFVDFAVYLVWVCCFVIVRIVVDVVLDLLLFVCWLFCWLVFMVGYICCLFFVVVDAFCLWLNVWIWFGFVYFGNCLVYYVFVRLAFVFVCDVDVFGLLYLLYGVFFCLFVETFVFWA